MKRLVLLLALLFAVVGSARAQTPVTVTGTVNSPAGGLATSGTVTFTLTPNSASILYYVNGLNIIAPTVGTCGINGSGQIMSVTNLANPCLVWGNDVITPGNTTYTVQFYPNGTPAQLIRQLLIGGASFSFAAPVFAPQVNINPQYQTIQTSPIAVNLVPVAAHVFTIGQSGLPYASLYVDNIFVTNSFSVLNLTVPGTLHVVGATTLDSTLSVGGLATFNAGITGTGDTGTLTPGSGITTSIYSNPHTWTGLQTFSAGITGTGNTGALLPGTGILGTSNTWTVLQNVASLYPTSSAAHLGNTTTPWSELFVGAVSGQYSLLTSLASAGRAVAIPDTSGTLSFDVVENCGATSGGTQACAKTVVNNPIIVFGDVALNTATTQAITTLPFTAAGDYSCSGSDLTTPAGVVGFPTYTSGAQVTIQETGGANTDHLRYMCVGF